MEIIGLLMAAALGWGVIYVVFFYCGRDRRRRLPPGPRGYPLLGNLPHLGAMPHQNLAAIARRYGPLIYLKFGTVDVVVASAAGVAAQLLRTHDSNFLNRPPNSGAEHMAYNYQDLVFAPYGQRWRSLRKLCAVHLFSGKALDELRPVRETELRMMVGRLYGSAGAEVDLGKAANACATNALSRAVVGRRVFTDAEDLSGFKEMVVELMQLAGVFNVGDFVPGIGWMDLQGVVGRMKRLHARFDKLFDGMIEERRRRAKGGRMEEEQEDGKDLLTVLLALQRDGRRKLADADADAGDDAFAVTDTDIKALLLNLFAAGTDTSSSTAEWAVAELIRHPDLLRQAQQELDAVVGRSRLVAESDLSSLPFFTAVIKETFRLHPSTPLSLPRIAAADCVVDGLLIPKNATLLMNVWAIGRDPAAWPEPLEFRPGRFLAGGTHPDVDVKGADFELIPFGAGRRICAGLSLGLRMVTAMAATLVHAFDWKLPDGVTPEELDMAESFGLTLQRAAPLVVRPIPRLDAGAYLLAGE